SRRASQARTTPGSTSTSAAVPGEYGKPFRTGAAIRTPSRSRKTARPDSDEATSRVLKHRRHRLPESFTRRMGRLPTETPDPIDVQAHHRNVALPATVAAAVLVPDGIGIEAGALGRQPGDPGDR